MPRVSAEERHARSTHQRWQHSEPKPPADLTKAGRLEWDRITSLLRERQQLDTIDQASLRDYVYSYEGLVEAQAEIQEHGVLIAGRRKGERIKNPALQVLRTYREQFRKWCGEFGFTPMSRQRLGIHGTIETAGGPDQIESLLAELSSEELTQ